MPEKSVREMNEFERKHYSLEGKVFRTTVLGAAILGLVAFLIGLGLYTYALVEQYIGESYGLSRSTAIVIDAVADTEELADNVMSLYKGYSEEEKTGDKSHEYNIKLTNILGSKEYSEILRVLSAFKGSSDVFDIYLGMFDSNRSSLVYVVDPETDPEFVCRPGDWEKVTEREIDTFLNLKQKNGRIYDISKTDRYGWMCTAGVPLYNEAGEVVSYVLADVTLENVAKGMKTFTIWYTVAMFVIVSLYAILLLKYMKKDLVQPVNAIALAAQEYAEDRKEGKTFTDRFSMLNIKTGDEIENLSLVMADMERDLSEYVENLTNVTEEKARMGTELDMAAKIQASMLPHIFPPYPEREEFDIYASMEPAKEVGGDFYDFFLIDDDHLAIVMADVSGKGVPASLFMMASKCILQSIAMLGKSAGVVLHRTNEALCSNNQMDMFVTVWLGILEISTGKLTTSNAGHEYPVIKKPGGRFEMIKDPHSFVLGGFEDEFYEEFETVLEPGSKLFLYTDGLPEAMDGERNQYGLDRMVETLNKKPDADPKTLLGIVRKDVDAFVNGADQFDDLTMLCIEYKGPKQL